MEANDRQVAGDHYKENGMQHWDMVQHFQLDYFQGQITKYLFRWKKKNGLQDLEKAQHYLEKYMEIAKQEKGPDLEFRTKLHQHQWRLTENGVESCVWCQEKRKDSGEPVSQYTNQD